MEIDMQVPPETIQSPLAPLRFREPPLTDTVVFRDFHGTEMMKITKGAFYVRGKKVPQDDAEALTVYNTFVSWLERSRLDE